MDGIPSEEFSISPTVKTGYGRDRRGQMAAMSFAGIVTLVVLIMVFAASYVQQSRLPDTDSTRIEDATWSIARTEPTAGSASDIDLTLTSSIGNVRRYSGVRSYGLSNDRRTLAISNSTALSLIDLATDKRTKVTPAFDYAGDMGNVITWSADSTYFAMAVHKAREPNNTHIVIYTGAGAVQKDIATTLAHEDRNSNAYVYPVKFSPTRNLLIARTYKSEDVEYYKSQKLTTDQLPVTLRAFNMEGTSVKDVSVRDAITSAAKSRIIYFWDPTGTYLTYLVTSNGTEINYADEAQFTKIAI